MEGLGTDGGSDILRQQLASKREGDSFEPEFRRRELIEP
jgi:hypothetical protein